MVIQIFGLGAFHPKIDQIFLNLSILFFILVFGLAVVGAVLKSLIIYSQIWKLLAFIYFLIKEVRKLFLTKCRGSRWVENCIHLAFAFEMEYLIPELFIKWIPFPETN